jgi:hypothetical protein
MSKSTEYLRAAARCREKAERSPAEEFSQLWLTISESYKYLADLQNRGPPACAPTLAFKNSGEASFSAKQRRLASARGV